MAQIPRCQKWSPISIMKVYTTLGHQHILKFSASWKPVTKEAVQSAPGVVQGSCLTSTVQWPMAQVPALPSVSELPGLRFDLTSAQKNQNARFTPVFPDFSGVKWSF